MRSSASSEVVFAWIELISLVFLFGLLTVVESPMLLGLSVMVPYSAMKFFQSAFSRRQRPVATVFWLYHAFFLLIPGWIQVLNNYYPWAKVASDIDMAHAVNAVMLASASFSFFYTVSKRTRKNYGQNGYNQGKNNVESLTALKAILALAGTLPAVGLIAILGPKSFFAERSVVGQLVYQSDDLAMLYNVAKFSVFGVAMVSFAFVLNKSQRKLGNDSLIGHASLRIVTILTLIISLIVNNPISSPRFHFLGMLLAALMVFIPMRSRLTRCVFWTAAAVFLYTLFPLVKNITDSVSNSDLSLPDVTFYLKSGVDFDGLQQLANIAKMTDGLGISFGSNFLSAILFWVPRSIWPTKAIITGALAADYVGYDYSNLSAPLIGETLYGFGMLGTIAFFSVMGCVASKLDRKYEASLNFRSVSRERIFIGTLVGFLFILLRGSLNAVFPQVGVALIVILVLAPSIKAGKLRSGVREKTIKKMNTGLWVKQRDRRNWPFANRGPL
jgi:hypothetical protein